MRHGEDTVRLRNVCHEKDKLSQARYDLSGTSR
jgi:hypothetical protein